MIKEVERQALEQMTTSLRGKCVSILNERGVPDRKIGLEIVHGIVSRLLDPICTDKLTLNERLTRRTVREYVFIRGRETPVMVAISSLGDASPSDADHVLLYIPHINSYKSVDVGARTAEFRRNIGDRVFDSQLGGKGIRMLAGYSKMVDIFIENLSTKPRS